ncbi:MAG TPA: glutathione S-transferase family protein [Steroidobacteraceae bacterium]|jgi:glutathione S-transferase|nr:glutathione S-transferase family protein [Steroidobacteraceae bacterium]
MKLYSAKEAPNPRRVTIYLAEKGLKIDRVEFAPPFKDLKTPEFLIKNPAGKVPVLELDNGICIAESAAIVEYLEEVYPATPMIGTTAVERAHVRTLERIASDLFARLVLYLRHSNPEFMASHGMTSHPIIAAEMAPSVEHTLNVLETRIGDNLFLAGPHPTIADCTLFALLNASTRLNYSLPEGFPRLRGWYQRFSERPSAVA